MFWGHALLYMSDRGADEGADLEMTEKLGDLDAS